MHRRLYPADTSLPAMFPDLQKVYEDSYVRVFRATADQLPALIIDRSWLAVVFDHVRDDPDRAHALIELLAFPNEAECDRHLAALAEELAALSYGPLEADEQAYQFRLHYAAVERGYAEHQAARYPPGHYREIGDHALVLIDADIAGCVSTFLGRGGNPGLWRTAALGLCYGAVLEILPALSDAEGLAYFGRLAELARRTLLATGIQAQAQDPD